MGSKTKTASVTLLIVLVLGVSTMVWWQWVRPEQLPDGLVQANGRIEGDHYTVAGKVPGKIVKILAREGDAVEAEQVLAQFDDVQVRAKVAQAKHRLAAGESQCDVAAAAEQQNRRDKDRLDTLFSKKMVAKHDVERAGSDWEMSRDRLEVAKAECEVAKAALVEVQSVLSDLTIRAPARGVITTRIADKGEVVAAGSPLFDIVDLDRLYLKVYVPEKQIGKVRLGLPARVYTDAFPNKPFPATVRYIASQAEFTPKEVQTPDERVKLVYAVKLYLDENPEHRLTPGLPADAIIRWQESVPWTKPRW